ncbi:MAG: VOC family protein [Candidatus Kapabacteria bacterium]|nr:VOC family protein [Candidatus Kapabacteria bacterium]
MNTIGYFEIQSSNPAREIEFYKNVFGWNFIREKFVPIEYYRIETDGISGGLLIRPVAVPPMQYGTNAFVCSIEVENFDKTSELILRNGGIIALPKFAIQGRCWQGYFLDLDNNTFGIFEVNEKAGTE